jgi:hypothetical protein
MSAYHELAHHELKGGVRASSCAAGLGSCTTMHLQTFSQSASTLLIGGLSDKGTTLHL